MGDSIVFGVNAPEKFVVFGGKTFAPAANGVVVTKKDGSESMFWQPTNGLYAVDCIAVSTKGVLCLTERRLSVSLHFYTAADMRPVKEVKDVARSGVQGLAFDETGSTLAVLCSTPTSAIKVFASSVYGGFTLSRTIALPDELFVSIGAMGSGFLVSGESRVMGFTQQADGDYVEGFDLPHEGPAVITAAAGTDSMIAYGDSDGRVYQLILADKGDDPYVALECHDEGSVSALYFAEDRSLYVACGNGALLQARLSSAENAPAEVIFSASLPCGAAKILPTDDSTTALIAATSQGFYRVDVDGTFVDRVTVTPVRTHVSSEIVGCHAMSDRQHMVAVCYDGSFFVTDLTKNVKYFSTSTACSEDCVLDSCLVRDMLVILHGADHCVTVHDLSTGRLTATLPYGNTEAKPTRCVANPAGYLVVFDERCVFFYTPQEEEAGFQFVPCGFFVVDPLAMMSSFISSAYGLPAPKTAAGAAAAPQAADNENRFLVTCKSGEIYLVGAPSIATSTVETEHSPEAVILGMWRADFPVVEIAPCYVESDIINVLAHSLDKDTKLYALDVRQGKDPKGTNIRPYFLMRDHESCGAALALLDDGITMCSAGKDGRIVLRDVSPYQKKLTPIPPSKERRKIAGEMTAWHFAGGGVAKMAMLGNAVACIGAKSCPSSYSTSTPATIRNASSLAPVMKVLALPKVAKSASPALPDQRSKGSQWWREPSWSVQGSSDQQSTAEVLEERLETVSPAHAVEIRDGIVRELETLRQEWAEQMKTLEEVDIAVEDVLREDEKMRFQESCEDAVFAMREDEYYGQLENQYIQEVIKQRCCQTMEVARGKISSLIAPDREVHNFHVAKECRPRLRIAKKMAFLRGLQSKAATSLAANRAERGFSFQQHHAPLRMEADSAEETVFTDDTTSGLHQALFAPCNVYTNGRAGLQAALLKGIVQALKDAYNREYNLLKQRKQSALALIAERTHRCVQILKQLGEVTNGGGAANMPALEKLFAARVDREEDGDTLFTVQDEELPEAVRALIPKKEGAAVYSPENEAALKLWMDGLEKDVELIQVTLPVPDFADETKDTFIPAEERTDEQGRQYEEYEKKLKEEVEAVESRKSALRNELATLQKQNRAAAEELDTALSRLRTRRVAFAECIDAMELQVVQLNQQRLKVDDAFRQMALLGSEREACIKRVQHLEASAELKQHVVASTRSAIVSAGEEIHSYAESVRDAAPFTDAEHGEKVLRRFTRWKRKLEDDKGEAPDIGKAPDDCPAELWEQYHEHCEYLLTLRAKVARAEAEHQAEVMELQSMEEERMTLLHHSEGAESEQERLAECLIPELINTAAIFSLHQGQVQDERAAVTSDFRTCCLRWTDDVVRFNSLIFDSYAESGKLLEKIVKRRRRMKELAFETKRLQYCVGTLRLELRQLHTLRVTRLMQEWLAGDADVSEEKTLAKIDSHIQFVNDNMRRKVGDLEKVKRKIRSQLSEREVENSLISQERETLRCNVRDASAIRSLVRADGEAEFAVRAREIHETSELEELARSQQEELIRLKKRVDALRERTFPSFAVVSKQRM